MKTLAKTFLIEWNSLVSWLQVSWVFLCACRIPLFHSILLCISEVRWYSDLLITSEIAVSFEWNEAYAYKFVDLTKLLKILQ